MTTSQVSDNLPLRTYYPAIEPYKTGMLPVDATHTIYWEESGNPEGQPILYLHGGPGGSAEPKHRRFFDPTYYRIILMDQRGCGKSLPLGSLDNNTTWDLVADLEKLRQHLHIQQWILFGGSWGSTLALCYAIKHAEYVQSLILRGIFLCRPEELHWFYNSGARWIYPDAWEQFIAPIPVEDRMDLLGGYYEILTKPTFAQRARAVQAWVSWELNALKLQADQQLIANYQVDELGDALARIECHYFVHEAFLETPNWIIENADAIAHIPTTLVHGRYDMVCPVANAWDLHKALPNSTLEIIPDAGHSASETGTLDALIRATDAMKK